MRYLVPVLCLFLFISLPFAVIAQDNSAQILDVQEVVSDEGITAWLVEDHTVPVISMHFAFKGAGSALEPDEKQGLVQLLSNTMDEGAADLDSQTFQKTLADNSISLSFSGGRDNFGGSLKTLTKNKDLAFDLLSKALIEPRFDNEPLDRMKQSNLSRIKTSLTDPDWIAARLQNDLAFEGHPYARNSGGTLSSLPKITAEDLRSFAKKEFTKDRLIVSVAGDISPEQVKSMLDEIFSDLPEKPEKPSETNDIALKNGNEIAYFGLDVPQSAVRIIYEGIQRDDPDYYAFQVMNQIFGAGGFGSRLMEEVREKKGLTYGIYSSLQRLNHAQLIVIGASTQTKTVDELVSTVDQTIQNMKQNGVTEQELEDAQSYILGSLPLGLTSTGAISATLLSLQEEDLPKDYLDQLRDKIRNITREDVSQIAQRLLTDDDRLVIIVGEEKPASATREITELPNAL